MTIAFSVLTITLAAMLYSARVDVTEPGGRSLKGLSVYVIGLPAVLSGIVAFVIAAFALVRASFSRAAILSLVLPFLGTISVVVAISLPVGETLLRAIHREDVSSVRTTLQAGVDPNVRMIWGWHNLSGDGALTIASRGGNAEIVRLLIDHGAAVNTNDGETPLFAAAQAGQLEVVTLLLQAGADVNHMDDKGRSAYRNAVFMGHTQVAEALFAAGAKAEVIPDTQDIP